MVDSGLRGRLGNRLLACLSRSDRELIEPHLKPVRLHPRQRLQMAHRKVRAVYFLESGLASVVAIGASQRRQAEMGIVGHEGMTGIPVLLGFDRSPTEVSVQLAGTAQCIDADDLRDLIAENPTIHVTLLRYVHAFVVQIGHTALANAKGNIEERLARWLLMAHDRLDGDNINLTHDFLATMLGSRRAGVTVALNHLHDKALIANTRGCITILDRQGLEEIAAGLYGVPEKELERAFAG
jgi:CRP-like cAMP-binding protein